MEPCGDGTSCPDPSLHNTGRPCSVRAWPQLPWGPSPARRVPEPCTRTPAMGQRRAGSAFRQASCLLLAPRLSKARLAHAFPEDASASTHPRRGPGREEKLFVLP